MPGSLHKVSNSRQDKHAIDAMCRGRSSSDLALISIACNRCNSYPPTPLLSSPDADRSELFTSTSSWGGAGWCDRTSSCAVMLLVKVQYPVQPSRSWNKIVVMTYAVDSPRWQTCVALAADHLVAVVLGGKGLERGLDDTTTETEDQVKG